ncbi:MAG: DoxX family membrane protein [Proteiniphilum sp.]|jgi:thiosulfate dehydrogenase [quinone] large subunit|nr:DoxX family membrane protein [Proteiniphilum sp.]
MKQKLYSNGQVLSIVILRILTGWHLLYEGMIKVFDPGWTAAPFLNNAQGTFAALFKNIASSPLLLEIADQLNQWGLALVGLSLILGFLSRPASIGGMALLFFYYVAYPPFIGVEQGMAEGNYMIVNKNLIELFVFLLFFMFPTDRIIGLERLFYRSKNQTFTHNVKNVAAGNR